MHPRRLPSTLSTVLAVALAVVAVSGRDVSASPPGPGGDPGDASKPVKVYILSGQSNMVGAGKVDGGSSRWGSQFIDPEVSVYQGIYDAEADYDQLEPIETLES